MCVPGPGGAGPGQCDGAARGRGSLPLLGRQPAGAARLGEDGRGRGGARVARGGAGQVSSLEAMLHVLHVDCPPVTGCCSPRPGSWASWCGWRSACTGGTTASTSPPATDPPARRTTHPGQSAQPVYYIYTPCLLSIPYLHTVSTIYTISTHRVYILYYIYTPCLPSIPYLHTVCTYLIYISTPQHRAGHLHGHRPRAHLHHSQRANILLLLCQRFCVLLITFVYQIRCLQATMIMYLYTVECRSYHLRK